MAVIALRDLLYIKKYKREGGRLKQILIKTGLRVNKSNYKKAKVIELQLDADKEEISLKYAKQLFLEKDMSHKTLLVYKTALSFLPDSLPVRYVNRAHFDCILNKDLSHNSKATYLRHCRIFFNFLLRKRYIEENPVPVLRSQDVPIRTIPHSDFMKLLKTALQLHKEEKTKVHLRWYYALKLLQLTGLRNNEATRLTWDDVDFENKILYVKNQKGKRTDKFPLYKSLEKLLKAIKRENLGKGVLGYSPTEIMSFMPYLCAKSGTPRYTFHDIRRTFATDLVNRKLSLFDVMQLLRHKEVRTTLKFYAKADLDRICKELEK